MHSENTKDQNQIKGNLAVEANRESYNHIWTMFAKIRPNKGAKENAIVRNNLQYTRHLACKIRSATRGSFYMNKNHRTKPLPFPNCTRLFANVITDFFASHGRTLSW